MYPRFTVLSLDQVTGPNKLDVFRRYGSEAAPTTYAMARGVEDFILRGRYFAEKNMEVKGTLLNQSCCEYWTSTRVDGSVAKCYSYGKLDAQAEPAWNDDNGIRLVVPLESIQDYITSSYTIEGENGTVNVVTYGEYPQDLIVGDDKRTLTQLYNDGYLKPTGKKYAAVGFRTEMFYDGNTRKFERDEYPEYIYNNEKYVMANKAYFHNGDSRMIWAKVRPIEWIIDEQSGLAITKDCIVGGIPLSRKGLYFGNFDKTLVQDFIDNDLANDISYKATELNAMIQETQDITDEAQKSL